MARRVQDQQPIGAIGDSCLYVWFCQLQISDLWRAFSWGQWKRAHPGLSSALSFDLRESPRFPHVDLMAGFDPPALAASHRPSLTGAIASWQKRLRRILSGS